MATPWRRKCAYSAQRGSGSMKPEPDAGFRLAVRGDFLPSTARRARNRRDQRDQSRGRFDWRRPQMIVLDTNVSRPYAAEAPESVRMAEPQPAENIWTPPSRCSSSLASRSGRGRSANGTGSVLARTRRCGLRRPHPDFDLRAARAAAETGRPNAPAKPDGRDARYQIAGIALRASDPRNAQTRRFRRCGRAACRSLEGRRD